MNRTDIIRSLKSFFSLLLRKTLPLYVLAPVVCLYFLHQPICSAVRASGSAAFLILLAAFGAVLLNWLVYTVIHRKHPSLLVYAYGVFCLLLVNLIEYNAIPAYDPLASSLATIAGCLTFIFLFLLGFWFAARNTRLSRVFAVAAWITIGLLAFFMLFQILRDFESRKATSNTWIALLILIALIPAAFTYRIRSSIRRAMFRHRATGLAAGCIVQFIGETRLDLDGDPVTDYHARIEYTVDDVQYETRAEIYKLTMRWLGKKALVGQEIAVHYDPANPADAYADRIDRHFLDGLEEDEPEQEAPSEPPADTPEKACL